MVRTEFTGDKAVARGPLPEYRACLIESDGHLIKRVELVCTDDEAAKEQAKTCRVARRRAFAGGPQDRGVQVEALGGGKRFRSQLCHGEPGPAVRVFPNQIISALPFCPQLLTAHQHSLKNR
jgi:hypothetical protein